MKRVAPEGNYFSIMQLMQGMSLIDATTDVNKEHVMIENER